MSKRKRDPDRIRQPRVKLHNVWKKPDGTYDTPPDLPADALPLPFQGEPMECALCGRKEKSDPAVESHWRVLSVDGGLRHYFCPDEFPPDGSPGEFFQVAYELAMAVALARKIGDQSVIIEAQKIRENLPWRT